MEKYKELLAEKLRETQGREMYSQTEVRDILLDLWLTLKADHPEIADDLEAELVATG